MTPIDNVLLFGSTFANVFLLGFQSKNVMHSRYVLAALTSIGITLAQYFFVRYAANGDGLLFLIVSGMGGSLGIMSAIWVHDRLAKRKERAYESHN